MINAFAVRSRLAVGRLKKRHLAHAIRRISPATSRVGH